MKTALLTAAALILGLAQANEIVEEYVQTEIFGDYSFHEYNTLDSSARAGIIVGWILFGIIVVVSFVLVFNATIQRSKEYEQNLERARSDMKKLGINIGQVDREFDIIQSGQVKSEEQFDLIEIALGEGKKMKGGSNQV